MPFGGAFSRCLCFLFTLVIPLEMPSRLRFRIFQLSLLSQRYPSFVSNPFFSRSAIARCMVFTTAIPCVAGWFGRTIPDGMARA